MLTIAGIIAIVIFTRHAYSSAKDTGRNPVLWAFACAATGIGFQYIVPIFLVIAVGIYYMLTGTPEDQIEDAITGPVAILSPAFLLSIAGLILSFVGMGAVVKNAMSVKDEPLDIQGPPPPPSFDPRA